MSRTILTLALASSVSALLPAKVPGRVRGVYSAPLASSALLSMRSRPPYMSIDPDTHTKIAAAGYSSGFSDGLKCASAMVGAPKEAEAGPPFIPPFEPGPVIIPPIPDSAAEDSRCKDAAKGIKGVDGPLLQTLATVCCTIDDVGTKSTKLKPHPKRDPLQAKYVPKDGPVNPDLDQPYKPDRASGVTDGGVTAFEAFKTALKPYGTVLDGSITDWHDELEVAIPPFAALVVQPKTDPLAISIETEVRTPPSPPHPVSELCLVLRTGRRATPEPHPGDSLHP